ncbi:MAG: hypothetical protein OXC07_00260 [Kistimonas sp.]|nr:hypothetical protein [Kistimonas sp.]
MSQDKTFDGYDHSDDPFLDCVLSESLQNRCRKSRQNKCKHQQARTIRQGIDDYFDSRDEHMGNGSSFRPPEY